jgi:hypothetical protein
MPAGISCGTGCAATFAAGTSVTLQARTTNGSGYFFSGWSGGGCSGPFHDCTVTVNGHVTVQATFTQMTNNLVFVTSTSFAPSAGNAGAYDRDCNSVATAAGINDSSGQTYVAYLSDNTSSVDSRLAGARAWVRMDGRPFTDTLSSLFMSNQVMNPIRFDETGAQVGSRNSPVAAMTGIGSAGGVSNASDDCGNWAGASATGDSVITGDPGGGPFYWDPNGLERDGCTGSDRLICMGKTHNAPLPVPVVSGKLVWLSAVWPGYPAPDTHCANAMPAGVTGAKALIARSTAPASSVVNATTNYYRPDGMFVGTGAQLGAGGPIVTGIWQIANGTYSTAGPLDSAVLTGKNGGTAADNCNDWSPNPGTTMTWSGDASYYETWWGYLSVPCPAQTGGNSYFYCVQTAP